MSDETHGVVHSIFARIYSRAQIDQLRMMSKHELIRYAERALDRALDEVAIAGAAIRFAEAGEIDLAERARRLLEAEARKRVR